MVSGAGSVLAWEGLLEGGAAAPQSSPQSEQAQSSQSSEPPDAEISEKEVDYRPAFADAYEDYPKRMTSECNGKPRVSDLLPCFWGEEGAAKTIALVGGSHAAQWITPVLEGAESAGANVVSYTMNSCTFGDVRSMSQDFYPACKEWNDALLAVLLADPPDLVVMVATRFVDGQEEFPEGYRTYIQALTDAGIPVLGVRDNPKLPHKAPACVETKGAEACAVPREEVYGPLADLGLPQLSLFTFLDLSGVYCRADVCPMVQGDVLIYRDSAHLTETWVGENGWPVAEAVRSALAD